MQHFFENLLFSIWHVRYFWTFDWYKNDISSLIYAFHFHTNFDGSKDLQRFFLDFEYFIIFLVASCMCVCSWPFFGPIVVHSDIQYCPYYRNVLHVAASFLGCEINKKFSMIKQRWNGLSCHSTLITSIILLISIHKWILFLSHSWCLWCYIYGLHGYLYFHIPRTSYIRNYLYWYSEMDDRPDPEFWIQFHIYQDPL